MYNFTWMTSVPEEPLTVVGTFNYQLLEVLATFQLLRWRKLNAKIFLRREVSVRTYAYMCEYRIKVASYTGIHLNMLYCKVLIIHH